MLSSLFQLVVAGHDATASLIGNGVVALLDHPGQLQALLADMRQLPAAVDELIRFTAPVPHATFRARPSRWRWAACRSRRTSRYWCA